MQHETQTIAAQPRTQTGTRYARRMRNSGQLPAVMYGHKADPVHISIDAREVLRVIKHGAHVVNVAVDGQKPQTCLVKDLQYGYLGDNLIHVDFARVDLDEEVEVNVHIKFVGHPESAKKPGSVLSYPMTELPVICKVMAIPDEIRVDISSMETMFTVGEVKLPQGVRTEIAAHLPVAQITYVHEEVVASPEAADVTAAAGAEPEVIGDAEKAAKAAAAAEAAPAKEGGKKEAKG